MQKIMIFFLPVVVIFLDFPEYMNIFKKRERVPAWRNGLRSGCQVVELDGGKAGGKVKWNKNGYIFWRDEGK
jgi:hypothetical protein